MRPMQFHHLLFILMLGTLNSFGQNTPKSQNALGYYGTPATGLNGPIGVFDTQKNIKGTPYLFEEWYIGEITFLNNRNLPVEKLRYDIYKDELLIFRSEEEMGILPKNVIKSFILYYPKSFDPLQYVKASQIPALQNLPTEQFLQVLYQSENTGLYARNWKTFHKADERATYYTEKVVDEFSEPKQELFLVKNDGSVHELSLRRGAILNALKEHKAALKNFIRENQFSFENTNDLIEVIKHYETLEYAEQS